MENDNINLEVLSGRLVIVGKIAAILLAALGLYILITLSIGLYNGFKEQFHLSDIFFFIVFPIPMFILSLFCFFAAYQSWKQLSSRTIHQISFIAALIFSVLVSFYLLPKEFINGKYASPLPFIVGGIFYVFCSKFILKWLSLHEIINWSRREKHVKIYVGFIAVLAWSSVCNIIIDLMPNKMTMPGFWVFAVILPIYLLYKLTVKIFLRNKPKEAATV